MLIDLFHGNQVTDQKVVDDLFYVDPYSGGSLEQLEAKVRILENLVTKMLLRDGLTAEQANFLCGWQQYGED